jgi:predicted negative regulator of RcsB-dependent stress response
MAFKEVKQFSNAFVQQGYFSVSRYVRQFKYARELFLAGVLLVVAILGFLSYRWYVSYREQAAQQALAESIELVHKASAANTPDEWASVATRLQLAYDQHSHSYMAPYFLAFRAQALSEMGKKAEAQELMETVVKTIPASSELAPLFKTRQALMLLDAHDEQEQRRGLQLLQALAQDIHNRAQDMAQFYLGSYFAAHGKTEEAFQAWHTLINNQQDGKYTSPWVAQAQRQLSVLKK